MVHVKWEPFRDLMAMQDRMTRLIDETLAHLWKEEGVARGAWSPPADILEKENEIVLKIDLPEMKQSEIEISVEENMLIVKGERKFGKETPDERVIQIERRYGVFYRTFSLSRRIDQEGIKASYKDGVLRIALRKKEEVRPKQIALD
jgi:HSP20 family protein